MRDIYSWGGPTYPSYDGMMKGGNSKSEMQAANEQRAMENQLMQQQLNMQMQQISGVNAALDPIIKAGGMSPEQQAALTATAMNQLPAQFRGLQAQLNNDLVARGMTGGNNAGAGAVASGFGQLGAMEAGMQQQAMANIQLQKQQQLMQALGAKMGVAGMFGQNTGSFNQGATNALSSGVSAANNADQASTGFWGSLMGALASPFNITAKI